MKTLNTKALLAAFAAVAAATAVAAPAAAAEPYGRDDDRYEQRGRYEQPGRYEHRGYGQDRDHDTRGDDGWRDHGDQNINQRQQRLDWRIERGVRNGSLTSREAYRLREESRQIAYLESRYRRGGLSSWERADLDRRFDRLEYLMRSERRDRDYGSGYYR